MSDERGGGSAITSMRAATRDRLLARAEVDARQRSLPRARNRRALLGRGALVAAMAASVVFAVATRRDNASLRERLAAQDAERARLADSLRSTGARNDSMLAALTGPAVRVMRLTASTARSASAFMFWDTAHSRWTFVAHDLPALPAGRGYQLWLVTSDARVSVGMLPVSAGGTVMVQATYALPVGALRAVAVTEEPASGSPQPTTAPIIAAVAAGL